MKGAEESGDERMTMKLGRVQMMRALEGMKIDDESGNGGGMSMESGNGGVIRMG